MIIAGNKTDIASPEQIQAFQCDDDGGHPLNGPGEVLLENDKMVVQRLKDAAEEAKIELSEVKETHVLVEAIAMSDRILVMSARPGTIVEEIEVGLPLRDNPLERRKLPEIGPLVGRLMTLLKVGESAELH